MSLSVNNQNNIFFESENSLFPEDSANTAYGLESSNNEFFNGAKSNFVLDEISVETFDTPHLSQGDIDHKSIVFIDSAVPDKQTLIDNISGATEVVVLDKGRYELVQISEHLENYQQLDAVHIVSLGEAGQLSFTNNSLNLDTLGRYAGVLRSWGDALADDADIVLYGCDVALGSEGNTFLRRLSSITGADILASEDKTGFFGDWDLETTIGRVESDFIFDPTIQEVYLNTLDSGIITITPDTLPNFGRFNFYDSSFDFSRIAADDLVLFADANLNFGTLNPSSIAKFDFRDIPTEDLSILTDAGLSLTELDSQQITDIDYTDIPAENLEILTNSGDLRFDSLASEDIDNLNFKTIPAENLQILTNSGLNFQRLEEGDFREIDINNIPSENIQIMANGGLSLKSYSRESVLGVELSVLQDFGYISPESLSVLSLGGENDFGTLSDLVVANANLFEYKADEVSLGDGLSIAEAEVLNANDYNALNFSFTEDEIFDSEYYLNRNPDVADDVNRINPYTQYFLSGAYAPEYRDPTPYFDSSFYLETYGDVADDGINPLLHYFSSGARELRDPDAAFDTSFYLEEYTDVAEDGINPLLHYYFTNDSEVRYANETFKTLGETGEAIFVSSEINDTDFELFKDTAFSVIETRELEGTEVAGVVFAIPVLYKGVSLISVGLLSLQILNRANEIQDILDDESANILWIPDNEEVFKDNNLEKFPLPGYEGVFSGTPPFDTGEVTGFENNVFFPKGDNILEQVLTGQFEYPIDDEYDFSYFLTSEKSIGLYTPQSADILLNSQENITLELFGGRTGQLSGAINVDIIAEQGIKANLLTDGLSFVPDNSVEKIVTFNPFIPRESGGTGILDYLPEAARVLEPGGQIIINGTVTNKFTKVKQSDLERLGLRVVEKQIPLIEEYSGLTFRTIDGRELDKDRIKTTILEKI